MLKEMVSDALNYPMPPQSNFSPVESIQAPDMCFALTKLKKLFNKTSPPSCSDISSTSTISSCGYYGSNSSNNNNCLYDERDSRNKALALFTSSPPPRLTTAASLRASASVLRMDYIMNMRVSQGVKDSLLRITQGTRDLDLDFSDREFSILTESNYSSGDSGYEREVCKNEREEARRRLAMFDDIDDVDDEGLEDKRNGHPLEESLSLEYDDEMETSNQQLQDRLQSSQHSMQICFVGDDILDEDDDEIENDIPVRCGKGDDVTADDVEDANHEREEEGEEVEERRPLILTLSEASPTPLPNHPCFPGEIEKFTSKKSQLQSEATLALAQAHTMAFMQLEVEKQKKKKSPIAEMVGIPTLGNGRKLRVSRKKLAEMSIGQLQVLVNDLHSQIEALNEDLVHLLIERDDLHMEQDSMLVDIEDLTCHCKDTRTAKNRSSKNSRSSSNSRNSSGSSSNQHRSSSRHNPKNSNSSNSNSRNSNPASSSTTSSSSSHNNANNNINSNRNRSRANPTNPRDRRR